VLNFEYIPRCSMKKSDGKQCAMAASWYWRIDDGEKQRLCGTHVNLLKRQGKKVEEVD